MSQKPVSNVPAPVRVSGGIPVWLWLIMFVFGASIVAKLVTNAIPEDPKVFYENGLAALENGNAAAGAENIRKLAKFPEYAAKQKLLDGMLTLGTAKPLLAIPMLEEAAKEPEIRVKALSHLGSAFLRSNQRAAAIGTFETLLQDDENAEEVRLSLANAFKEIFSWNDSLKQLLILRERGYQPGVVHELIGDIYYDTGRIADAAPEYEMAFKADASDPANSRKAQKFVKCRIELNDVTGLEDVLPSVDAATVRESAIALEQLKNNETEKALATLEIPLKEYAGDATLSRVYGQIVATMGSEEKAVDALKILRRPLEVHTRNLKLYETIAKLAAVAKKDDIVKVAQENVDQLKELQAQFQAKLNEVIATRDDIQGRLDLGDAAFAAGQYELAQICYQSVTLIDETQEIASNKKLKALYSRSLPLVSFHDAFIDLETDTVTADPAPEADPTPEPDASTTPEPTTPEPTTPEPTTPEPPDEPSPN